MRDVLTLDHLDQLKALADPLRQRIVEGFYAAPLTTKQLAEQLGEAPTKLYHHVNALEAAGLIELVATRPKRGTTEKYYRSTARQFAVDHRLLSAIPADEKAGSTLHTLLVNVLEAGLAEARARFAHEAFDGDGLPAVIGSPTIRTTPEQAADLSQRLQDWLRDFQEAHDEEGSVEYGLTVAFYPFRPAN